MLLVRDGASVAFFATGAKTLVGDVELARTRAWPAETNQRQDAARRRGALQREAQNGPDD